jgi:hypothetical protein
MLQDGTPKDDVKVPEGDLGKNIEQAFEDGKEVTVTIIAAMGTLRLLFRLPLAIPACMLIPDV